MTSKQKSRRVPALAMRPLEAVARGLENPRVDGLVGRALRAALSRKGSGAPERFPAAPPLPPGAHGDAPDHDVNAMLGGLSAGSSNADDRAGTAAPAPSIAGYARAYARGSTNPVEVAEIVLQAVQESEQARTPMRFFISLDEADVRSQAAASALRHREGRPLSVLDGVPVAVKDEIDQRGYVTTLGTRIPGRPVATADCAAVARLRAQGAVLLGKTNMHEIGAGPTGWNANWGTCRNPWDDSRFPGGSSSGSAAVTAAGLVPLAIGCDGGGSIRIPASFCGVVGLKPTFGRVPKLGETPPIAHSVTHVGPMGQTVRDVAIGYAAIAGRHTDDGDTHAQPTPGPLSIDDIDLRGVTLGLVEAWWQEASPDVARACERARGALEACGARVVDVEIDGLSQVRDVLFATVGAELDHNEWLHDLAQRRVLAPDTRIGLALARHLPRTAYFEAQRARARIAGAVWRQMEGLHAFLSPTTLETAPAIPARGVSDLDQTVRILKTTALANLTGQPAISFPVGFDRSGLPIGMQAIGRPWDEVLLLRIAAAAERRREHRTPQRFWPTLPAL